MPTRFVLIAAAAAALLVGAAGLALYFYERPVVLRVAVTREGDDRDVLVAATHDFAQERSGVRLKLLPVDSLAESARAFEEERVDLAVVRADVALPAAGQTVLIMRRNAAVLMAPANSALRAVADLRGKRVAVVETVRAGRHGGQSLLDAALEQYDVSPAAVRRVFVAPGELGETLARHEADAALLIDTPGAQGMDAAVAAVAAAGGGPPVFIPIPDAEAIAQRLPNFESVEVLRGAFGGAIPKPAESFDTLGVSTRLIARHSLDNDVVSELTELFLSARPSLALREPLANRIEPPSTDKGATPPVHPGALAYLDDEEQTFFDKYSDFIYVGAMLASTLGAAGAALAARFRRQRGGEIDEILAALLAIMRAARQAQKPEALDALERDADAILERALAHDWNHAAAAARAAAANLALAQARQAIADRRAVLGPGPGRGGFAPPRLVGE
ncbi:TAXI family TRAP transporter solute-binding subunit [Methylocella sp.]|uniref:TAXI family TRAP transporter solute-binding subunit n=1 Tax=Methylocella sp. TaxID=1978226 RepID=UPI0037831446